MRENEQQLSPEEKLLKVIQEGGEDPARREAAALRELSSQEDVASDPLSESGDEDLANTLGVDLKELHDDRSADAASASSAKPKLKVARAASADADAAPRGAPATAGATVDGDRESVDRLSRGRGFSKKRSDPVQSISAVNKCLVLIVILLVALIGMQIWANVRTWSAESPGEIGLPDASAGGGGVEAQSAGAVVKLPSLEVMLSPFEERSLFFKVSEEQGGGGQEQPTPPPVIRSQLTLIGLTYETTVDGRKAQAIVMDNKADKMHFLTVGDTVGVDGRNITLGEIHPDRVVFTEGKNRITVESGKSND